MFATKPIFYFKFPRRKSIGAAVGVHRGALFRLQAQGNVTISPPPHHVRRLLSDETGKAATNESWSEEWKRLGLGARLPKAGSELNQLLFVELGFGVDQHGSPKDGATKAAVRAVRNAIEFNSIPGAITAIPGGREEMLIQVKLGVPRAEDSDEPLHVDLSHVAKVFPYGRLLPIEVVVGGLSFPTGRIVQELGDTDDIGICVTACISIG